METDIKNAPVPEDINNFNTNSIISGKTYKLNELYAIFSYKALMLCQTKEELYKYWYMAVETGNKYFIGVVDAVFNAKYPKYE